MNTEYDITSVEALRGVVGDETPGLKDKVIDHLDSYACDFLAKCPFVVLSTTDAQGRVDASPKGDAPGFVHVADDRTLWLPDRPGNRLVFGHLNVLENPQVGLLCLIPGTSETLRINGRGTLNADPAVLQQLAAREKPATLALRIEVEEVFFHCAKAFIRSKLWKADEWPERHKVSFGEMFAQRIQQQQGDSADQSESQKQQQDQQQQQQQLAQMIDTAVETDYRDNL